MNNELTFEDQPLFELSPIDFLDSIGYDNGDDDCDDYDPDDNHGFQNGVFDNITF